MFTKLRQRGFGLVDQVSSAMTRKPDEEAISFAQYGDLEDVSRRTFTTDMRRSPSGASRTPNEEMHRSESGGWGSGYQEKVSYGREVEGLEIPDVPDDLVDLPSGKDRINARQAGWNVTNAIQGMFMVTLPYAVLHGGWWSVFALIFVAYVCYYTGLILIECLYENGKRVRTSYVEIAEECWGKQIGGRLVHVAQLIELLMTCILYVMLSGDLLAGSFPQAAMTRTTWMMLSTIFLLPCAFLTNLQAVSALSFWNTVSHVIINAIVLVYCLTCAGSWVWSEVRWSLDVKTFPHVIGIVVFSYTSQIFLPSLEGNMEDRTAFKAMLKWTHIAAAVFKSTFGFVGFLTFGKFTQEEVTNNLPTQEFKCIINLIFVVKALLSYPLPYYASLQLIETAFFKGKPRTPFPSCFGSAAEGGIMLEWALALRIFLVLLTLFMAMSIPDFALLMGLIGSFTGCMLSFIWPCVFHLKLKRNEMKPLTRAWDMTIIGIGVLAGFSGIYSSLTRLARAMTTLKDVY